MSEVALAVVGLGYWGPNLARNVDSIAGARLAWCCDADPAKIALAQQVFDYDAIAVDAGCVLDLRGVTSAGASANVVRL